MKIEIEKLNKIYQELEKNTLELESVLDKLVAKRSKNISANESVLEIDTIISNALDYFPLKKTKQRYLPIVLNKTKNYSHIEKQIELIFFKRVLRKKYGLTVSPGGNDKLLDMRFAEALKIPTPSVYQENVMLDEVIFEKLPFVLKPTYGSNAKNVFYIHAIVNPE